MDFQNRQFLMPTQVWGEGKGRDTLPCQILSNSIG